MPRRAACAVLAAAVLLGCGGGKTFEDPRGELEVDQDASFTLEFETNASVGYDWRLDRRPRAASPVEYRETSVEVEDPDRDGSSARKRFEFEAPRAGVTALHFTRLYRGDVEERRVVAVRVR